MRLSVGDDGTVTGEFTNLTLTMTGTIKGVIDATGAFTGTYTVPRVIPSVALAGTLTKGDNGHVTGALTQGGADPLDIDLLVRELIPISVGRGTVTANDTVLSDGSHVHLVDFQPQQDCTLRISMQPSAKNGLKDPYLIIYDGNGPIGGTILASDDDSGGGQNAQLVFDFAQGSKYVIGFNGDGVDDFGGYEYQMEPLSSRVASAAVKHGGPKAAK